jgi:hypothetical protein
VDGGIVLAVKRAGSSVIYYSRAAFSLAWFHWASVGLAYSRWADRKWTSLSPVDHKSTKVLNYPISPSSTLSDMTGLTSSRPDSHPLIVYKLFLIAKWLSIQPRVPPSFRLSHLWITLQGCFSFFCLLPEI